MLTKERIQQSFDRLMEVMAPIAKHADHQATRRCPYKNKNNRCTAKFGCRNQRKPEDDGLLHCASDDKCYDNKYLTGTTTTTGKLSYVACSI